MGDFNFHLIKILFLLISINPSHGNTVGEPTSQDFYLH